MGDGDDDRDALVDSSCTAAEPIGSGRAVNEHPVARLHPGTPDAAQGVVAALGRGSGVWR